MDSKHKLYVQYQLCDEELQSLQRLQRLVFDLNQRARLVPANQLHLTVIHFGVISAIFDQIKAILPSLDRATYDRNLTVFVQACKAVMPANTVVNMVSYALYGEHGHTLVIEVSPSQMLKRVHEECLQALKSFFITCGIVDPQSYMLADKNFKHALTLHPHITLLKGASVMPHQPFEQENLHLEAMPILYA